MGEAFGLKAPEKKVIQLNKDCYSSFFFAYLPSLLSLKILSSLDVHLDIVPDSKLNHGPAGLSL